MTTSTPKQGDKEPEPHDIEHMSVSAMPASNAATIKALPESTSEDGAKFSDVWANRRVLGFCLLLYLLPINFGYEMGTLGKLYAVTPFAKRFGYEFEGTWLVAVPDQQLLGGAGTIGVFVSALATGYISDWIGRKKTILIGSVICIGGIIVQYFSTSIMMLFGGKLMATLGFGLGHSLAPVFVAELAPVKLRGFCLTLVNTMIMLGGWLNSITIVGCEHYNNDNAWRIPLITQLIPPCLLIIGLFFIPDSPTWLLVHGQEDKAAKAYRFYNGANFDVDAALAVAKVAIEQEKEMKGEQEGVGWLDCFKGSDGRRTFITVTVYTSQQFVGVTFLTGYLTYYFRLAGVDNALAVGQGAFAIQIAGNIVSWFLVDRVGRRPLFNGGAYAMTCLLLVIGGLGTLTTRPALLATTALMCLWGFLYQMTLGAVAYAICGETPSVRLRQKTYSLNMMISTAISTVIIQVTPFLINTDHANLGAKICFIFFALSLPTCIVLHFYLPELKGRNYAEIQEMFARKVPARQFKTFVCETSTK